MFLFQFFGTSDGKHKTYDITNVRMIKQVSLNAFIILPTVISFDVLIIQNTNCFSARARRDEGRARRKSTKNRYVDLSIVYCANKKCNAFLMLPLRRATATPIVSINSENSMRRAKAHGHCRSVYGASNLFEIQEKRVASEISLERYRTMLYMIQSRIACE